MNQDNEQVKSKCCGAVPTDAISFGNARGDFTDNGEASTNYMVCSKCGEVFEGDNEQPKEEWETLFDEKFTQESDGGLDAGIIRTWRMSCSPKTIKDFIREVERKAEERGRFEGFKEGMEAQKTIDMAMYGTTFSIKPNQHDNK